MCEQQHGFELRPAFGAILRLRESVQTDWRCFGDQAHQTTFADATEEADFAAERLSVNGKTIPRPKVLRRIEMVRKARA